VALGQTYFAVQTRRQELTDQEIEDQRRLVLRGECREHTLTSRMRRWARESSNRGDYAIFQNPRLRGLYGGLVAQRFTPARV